MTNKEEFETNCKAIINRFGKMWDIKPHVLSGQLWWKDAMEDTYNQGKQEANKDCKLVFNTIIHKLEDNRNRYSDIIVYIKKKIAELEK